MKKHLYFWLAAAVVSLLGMICSICLSEEKSQFEPPAFEQNAIADVPAIAREPYYVQGDAGGQKIGISGNVVLEGQNIVLHFMNSESNTAWIKLRFYDSSETLLGESGLIRPGEYLKSLPLQDTSTLADNILIKLMYYEPETYYSLGSAVLSVELTD